MSNLLNMINSFFVKIKEDIQKYTNPKNKLHIHPESVLSSRSIHKGIPINMNTTESSVIVVEKEENCCLLCRSIEQNYNCSKCDYYPGVERKEEESIFISDNSSTIEVSPSAQEVRDAVEVPPSAQEVRDAVEVPPSAQEVRDAVEVPPSAQEVRDAVEVPPSAQEVHDAVEVLPSSVEENNTLVTPVDSAVASIDDNNSISGTPTGDDMD